MRAISGTGSVLNCCVGVIRCRFFVIFMTLSSTKSILTSPNMPPWKLVPKSAPARLPQSRLEDTMMPQQLLFWEEIWSQYREMEPCAVEVATPIERGRQRKRPPVGEQSSPRGGRGSSRGRRGRRRTWMGRMPTTADIDALPGQCIKVPSCYEFL
jgi:hypothetical protein